MSTAPDADAERRSTLDVLRAQGFPNPEAWLDYARREGIRLTPFDRVHRCPECSGDAFDDLGQFVHYSTLSRLRLCRACGLGYSDTRLRPEVIRYHFDLYYKDEEYFRIERRPVFDEIARRVAALAPPGAHVLDVGGAKGHLLDEVRRLRPDLVLTLTDLSESACAWAREKYGLRALCGSLDVLERLEERFDVVILSDVLYLESAAPTLLSLLPRLLGHGGALLLRVPNTYGSIRVATALLRLVSTDAHRARRARIPFFNPEHVLVFSPRYLAGKLASLGFVEVAIGPADLAAPAGIVGVATRAFNVAARLVHRLSLGRIVLTHSLLVSARKPRA